MHYIWKHFCCRELLIHVWHIRQNTTRHYSDVTWASQCLKSLAIRLFVVQPLRLTTKKTSQLCITGPLWGESVRRICVDSTHKGPVMQRMFPRDDIVMTKLVCRSWIITSGPQFNIKMSSYQYRKSHCGDKTVVRSSYLHNGISYTGKMSSLYWIRMLIVFCGNCVGCNYLSMPTITGTNILICDDTPP